MDAKGDLGFIVRALLTIAFAVCVGLVSNKLVNDGVYSAVAAFIAFVGMMIFLFRNSESNLNDDEFYESKLRTDRRDKHIGMATGYGRFGPLGWRHINERRMRRK